jgi:hypothetical protein
MKTPPKPDPAQRWLTTFTWQDKLIARCFPKFFRRYAPDEIKEQWEAYQARKQKRSR